MNDDWERNLEVDQQVREALQRAQQNRVKGEMEAKLQALQQRTPQRRVVADVEAAASKAAAEQRARNETFAGREAWRLNTLRAPTPLTEGSSPFSLVQFAADPTSLEEQWEEARTGMQNARQQARSTSALREEARMAMRDALNLGVQSGLFTEDRALAIIALTGINDQPFPPEQAKENMRLAFKVAAETGVISGRVGGLAWKLVQDSLNDEPDLDLPADATRYEDLLYEVLTLRPCHLEEHGAFHEVQTMCSAHRGLLSQRLLDQLGLVSQMLPRVAHRDTRGVVLECCQDEVTQRWLDTGLTDLNPEV